jgi:hypothetical protein
MISPKGELFSGDHPMVSGWMKEIRENQVDLYLRKSREAAKRQVWNTMQGATGRAGASVIPINGDPLKVQRAL